MLVTKNKLEKYFEFIRLLSEPTLDTLFYPPKDYIKAFLKVNIFPNWNECGPQWHPLHPDFPPQKLKEYMMGESEPHCRALYEKPQLMRISQEAEKDRHMDKLKRNEFYQYLNGNGHYKAAFKLFLILKSGGAKTYNHRYSEFRFIRIAANAIFKLPKERQLRKPSSRDLLRPLEEYLKDLENYKSPERSDSRAFFIRNLTQDYLDAFGEVPPKSFISKVAKANGIKIADRTIYKHLETFRQK